MLDKGCKLKAETFFAQGCGWLFSFVECGGGLLLWRGCGTLSEFECDIKADDKSALIPKKPVEFADIVLLNDRIAVYAIQLFLRAAILILTRRTRRVNFVFTRILSMCYVYYQPRKFAPFMENLSVNYL